MLPLKRGVSFCISRSYLETYSDGLAGLCGPKPAVIPLFRPVLRSEKKPVNVGVRWANRDPACACIWRFKAEEKNMP